MKNKKHPRKLILISLIGALILLLPGVILLQQSNFHLRVAESVRDIRVLSHAIRARTLDYGPCAMYPEHAFVSYETRKAYGIDTTMPQHKVEMLGVVGPNDPPIYRQLQDTPWEHNIEYQIRLRRWEFLIWDYPQLAVSERAVRKNITDADAHAQLRAEAEKLSVDYRRYLNSLVSRSSIPHDPFALSREENLYRYGRPPDRLEDTIGAFAMWVIAGNGPDGDADLDVTRFNPVARQEKNHALRLDLGFDANPLDFIYDPTNGLTSDGDIVLFSELPGCDKALWDPACFRERYK